MLLVAERFTASLVSNEKLPESGSVPLLACRSGKSGNLVAELTNRLICGAARQRSKIYVKPMSLPWDDRHTLPLRGEPLHKRIVRVIGFYGRLHTDESGLTAHMARAMSPNLSIINKTVCL